MPYERAHVSLSSAPRHKHVKLHVSFESRVTEFVVKRTETTLMLPQPCGVSVVGGAVLRPGMQGDVLGLERCMLPAQASLCRLQFAHSPLYASPTTFPAQSGNTNIDL